LRQPRTIRGRMVRILAIPLATVLGLLGFIVAGEVGTYRVAARAESIVGLTLAAQDLVHELQRERGLTNGLLGGESRYRADVDAQRLRADTARANLDTVIARASVPAAADVRRALDLLSDQGGIRGRVDTGGADRAAVFDFYTSGINAIGGLNLGAAEVDDPALQHHLAALRALGDAKEAAAKERGFLNGVFASGAFKGEEYQRFAEIRATKRSALAQFDSVATGSQRAQADAAMRTPAATRAAVFEEAAVAAADGRLLKVEPRTWWDAMTVLVDDLRAVQQAVGADAQARADDMRQRATFQLGALLTAAALVVLAETLLLVSSARSVTGPLVRLAQEADEVASFRLPQAVAHVQSAAEDQAPAAVRVPEDAATEIRLVADALDRVQQTAYALAVEQAVLRRNTTESLANLGRRNQNLLRRQLGFISQLEREEADPSALANLFELDHLATRMRRNAESLLVLVGESSPRQSSAPVPIADVIRAATAEVEEYRRVELRRLDDGYVVGSAVTAVAHMIAELLENGLAFSPPDLNVEIYGRWMGTQYLIAVVDQGLGMEGDELAKANARLCGDESFMLGPARFLGHYVVGRLAGQLGAAVQLAPSPVSGITARVLLPASLAVASLEPTTQAPRAQPTPALTMVTPLALPALSAAAISAAPAGDRTANGLLKRATRTPTGSHRPATAEQPRHETFTSGSGPNSSPGSPTEVRTVLSAFRAGTQRGESRTAPPERSSP
jgi:signal transduction histidine kinase